MAKKKEETKETFSDVLKRMNKVYGEGAIMGLNDKFKGDYEVISTGSIGLDYGVLGVGGVVKGKLIELIGWEGCLSEDTFIKFINVKQDGIVQDCKGGTIKNLFKRFHNRSFLTQNTTFNVTSINEEDKVFRNRIIDVVQSGIKECFEVKTKKGFSVSTTKDHKFYTKDGYRPLSDLKKGSIVYIHNNTPFTKKDKKRKKYKETTLKNYYKGTPKIINGVSYFREKVHRLVYEANMNGYTYKEYKNLLNKSIPKDLITIPEGYEIHHINEITTDNSIENLQMYSKKNHSKFHSLENHNNLRFIVQKDEIISITSVGKKMTYDIKCAFPYNNFIAQGIVVHNSGKSTICGHLTANCQKDGGKVVYIDGEHAVDKNYFKALGVNIDTMLLSQPSCGEEGFNIAMEMIKTGEVDLVIIDSDSSLIPKKVVDGEIGDSAIGIKAKLNSSAYPKLKTKLVETNTAVVVISQYREKIGVMFGDPRTTQGGHALKYYTDCRIEISKSLEKEGGEVVSNLTKLKTIKNKTYPPYKKCEFSIAFGVGIDQKKELLDLASTVEIGRKYGKTYTFDDVKYNLDEFLGKLNDKLFFNELKAKVIDRLLNGIPVK